MTLPRFGSHPWKLPAVSGVALAVSYFSYSLPILNFVALVPLLAWIDANLEGDWKRWRRGGAVFGLTVNVLILHWMVSMLWISSFGLGAWFGLAAIFGTATTCVVMALAWARRATGWSFALLLPAFWLPVEWVQAQGDLRMTAQQLGHTLAGAPFLVQFVDLTGPYGAGLFVLVTNALIYEAWRTRRRGAWLALAAMWIAVLGYDAWAWNRTFGSGETLRVAFVQPNIPLATKMDSGTDEAQGRILDRLTRRAGTSVPDLIVWPETARPLAVYHDPTRPQTYAMPEVQRLAREFGATILVGVEYVRFETERDYKVWNAVMVVHPDGTLDPAWTAKVYLVPFVEGVPFRPILGPILEGKQGALRWIAGGFTPGPRGVVLPAAGTKVGATVCFEELYFDLNRELRNAGARLQVIATNHAWFRRTLFQRYAANTVRMRAIENRSAFVRAANTGISGFVDPHGRFLEETALFEEDLRVLDLPLAGAPTVYDRIGDVVAYLAIALGAVVVVVARRRTRREPPPSESPVVDPVPGAGPEANGPGDGPGGDGGGARGAPPGDGHVDPGAPGGAPRAEV